MNHLRLKKGRIIEQIIIKDIRNLFRPKNENR